MLSRTCSQRSIKTRDIEQANEFCAADGKHGVFIVEQPMGRLMLGLHIAKVHFNCDDRPAAQARKSAKP